MEQNLPPMDNERGFAQLVSEQRLCVVNVAPCEITHVMEITADYRTGFTDKMRIKYRMQHIVQPLSKCGPVKKKQNECKDSPMKFR